MKLIFGTTNKRKKEDLQSIIDELHLDIEVLNLEDIGWNKGEIEENGLTIEENSLIKAKAIYSFCINHNLFYPIITDDTGLFVDSLNGEPGIYTVRYADDELDKDSSLPDYQCVIKLLRNLEGKENRDASFKCCVTTMMPNGDYYQEVGETKGYIRRETPSDFKKPYHYCVFSLKEPDKLFNTLTKEELSNTFRFNALRNTLIKYIDTYNKKETEIIKTFTDRIKNNKSIECEYITPYNYELKEENNISKKELTLKK